MRIQYQIGVLCMAGMLVLPATSASAQKAVTAYTGTTEVTLSSDLVNALSSLKVNVGQVNPTTISDGVAAFPITNGALDLDTAEGNLLHSGGLTFSNDATKVRLQDFIIDTTGKSPVITGLVIVNDQVAGRLTLFDLAWPSGLTLPLKQHGNTLALDGVKVTLDSAAAGALNKVFSVSAFASGFSIGTADVTAYVSSSDWTY